MDDLSAIVALKNMISLAVDLCTDTQLLDLIYKLLNSDSCNTQNY